MFSPPIRVLICGSRRWRDFLPIRREILAVAAERPIACIIHGGNGYSDNETGAIVGADKIAGCVANELGLPVEVYPAEWRKHGKAAGPIRNAKMLAEGKPDILLAFTDNLAESRGTRDMVSKARAAGVLVNVFYC